MCLYVTENITLLENEELAQVDEFIYLGSVMTKDGKCRRIGLASTIVNKFIKLRRSNETKVKLYETFIVTVPLYDLECWCLRKEDKRRILTSEMT